MRLLLVRVIGVLLLGQLLACSEKSTGPEELAKTDSVAIPTAPEQPANVAPLAIAGVDHAVEEKTTVTLSGSGTDSDGGVSVYLWSQTAGKSVALDDPSSPTPAFFAPATSEAITLTFQLTVADNETATASDSVTITVLPVIEHPIADAGPDETVVDTDRSPGEWITLDGSASIETDGSITAYRWTIKGVEIATGVRPSIMLGDGEHHISLTVTDDEGLSDVNSVTVNVLQPNTKLGTNLSRVADWNGQWDFVDLMKGARPWISYNSTGASPWDTGLADLIAKDADGYPLQVPSPITGQPAQSMRTFIIHPEERLPSANYTVLFEGDGDLSFGGIDQGAVTRVSSNNYEVTVQFGKSLWLNIVRSDVENHVRNIRMITPGFEDDYERQVFHPLFLKRLQGFGVIRFMDYMATNDSTTTNWSQRTTPTSYTQRLGDGVSVEYMVELANRLNADAWFTMPHAVDDEYVTNFAQYVASNLNAHLNVYVEYSNELWNNLFSQTHWQRQAGCADPVTGTPHTGGTDWGIAGCDDGASAYRFQVKRTVEMLDIFEQAFGQDKARVIGVLASQAGNAWIGEQLLAAAADPTYNPKGIEIDALAIAPYFGGGVAENIVTEGVVSSITTANILQRMEDHMETAAFGRMVDNLVTANQYGVELIAYEGGQHLVAGGSNQNNEELTAKLIAAQSDPGMGVLYEKYFRYWYNNVGNVFANFSYVSQPGKFGSWGLLEYQDQVIMEAPKFKAIRDIQSDLFDFVFTP